VWIAFEWSEAAVPGQMSNCSVELEVVAEEQYVLSLEVLDVDHIVFYHQAGYTSDCAVDSALAHRPGNVEMVLDGGRQLVAYVPGMKNLLALDL